jgi:hypothetical protein
MPGGSGGGAVEEVELSFRKFMSSDCCSVSESREKEVGVFLKMTASETAAEIDRAHTISYPF